MGEPIELKGTVKKMSPSGKGFVLNEYDDWFNFGKGYDGPRPFAPGAGITITYEENVRGDGTTSFFVLSAWPTTGQAGPVPPQVAPAGPKPTAGPVPTNGPAPAKPASYDEYRATGPTPTPPSRENSILFQVCLKAAQDWVLAVDTVANTPAEVLNVADLYYAQGSRLINGEGLALEGDAPPQDGDPGPGEPA